MKNRELLGRIAEAMGYTATLAEAEAMLELLQERGYDPVEIGSLPEGEWSDLVREASAAADLQHWHVDDSA